MMQTGFTAADTAALTGWCVEAAMLRASAAALRANAEEVRRMLPASQVAGELLSLADLLATAADAPPPTAGSAGRGPLRLVR